MEPRWPDWIVKALGREPQVGDWYAPCCEEDLERITDIEDLRDIQDLIGDGLGGRFWATQEAALKELAEEKDS